MQIEHEKYNRQQGEGEAGEVHWLKNNAEEMELHLIRMEEMLKVLTEKHSKN